MKNLHLLSLCLALPLLLAACGGTPSEAKSSSPASISSPGSNPSSSSSFASSSSKATELRITSSLYQGKTLSLTNAGTQRYMKLTDEKEEAAFLSSHNGSNFDALNLSFSWSNTGSSQYTIHFSTQEDLSNPIDFSTSLHKIDTDTTGFGFLKPGETYYYWVSDKKGKTSKTDSFVVSADPIRLISVDGGYNVRDLGGWKAEGDKHMAFGKVFRGGKLNNITSLGQKTLKDELGIQYELDLRSSSDDYGQEASIIEEGGKYAQYPILGYGPCIPGYSRGWDANSKTSIQKIFQLFKKPSNYPIYFHCNAGADRTGTLAFLLEGLCGVSYEDMTRDFEITSFCPKSGRRWRSDIQNGAFTSNGIMQDDAHNYVAWGAMKEFVLTNYGTESGTLQDAIHNCLRSGFGIDEATLTAVKANLLA